MQSPLLRMLMASLFLSRAPHINFFPSSGTNLLVVWSANGGGSALTSKASSKFNLLNDDTYRWDCATVIMSSFKQLEQGAH